jgi:hypothetical protein
MDNICSGVVVGFSTSHPYPILGSVFTEAIHGFLLTRAQDGRPSDRRLSAKLVPNFADIGCRVVSATDPPGH